MLLFVQPWKGRTKHLIWDSRREADLRSVLHCAGNKPASGSSHTTSGQQRASTTALLAHSMPRSCYCNGTSKFAAMKLSWT